MKLVQHSLSNPNTADDREKTVVYFLINIMLPIKIHFTAWQILLDSERTMGIAKWSTELFGAQNGHQEIPFVLSRNLA